MPPTLVRAGTTSNREEFRTAVTTRGPPRSTPVLHGQIHWRGAQTTASKAEGRRIGAAQILWRITFRIQDSPQRAQHTGHTQKWLPRAAPCGGRRRCKRLRAGGTPQPATSCTDSSTDGFVRKWPRVDDASLSRWARTQEADGSHDHLRAPCIICRQGRTHPRNHEVGRADSGTSEFADVHSKRSCLCLLAAAGCSALTPCTLEARKHSQSRHIHAQGHFVLALERFMSRCHNITLSWVHACTQCCHRHC